MAGTFQDDVRENAMIELFGLYKDESEGRSGIDAYLDLNGKLVPFELKTTSKGSVTTVRDFGPDHIQKWKDKHWLIGFFMNGKEYYKYCSPAKMAEWIGAKEEYIRPDFELAEIAPSKLSLLDMYHILGEKPKYTYQDARKLQKNQYKKEKYVELQDVKNGYSPDRMLEILRDRAKYLMSRGSTLNNPHIPFNYFNDLDPITDNHSDKLRELVEKYFKSAIL